jgi:16S rRNA (cytidine1402-2'-O)-methyltransferase
MWYGDIVHQLVACTGGASATYNGCDEYAKELNTTVHEERVIAEKSTLYVVATPIGNLKDLSFRAFDILKSVDMIAAEDTRVSSKLLDYYGIAKKPISLHAHNEKHSVAPILAALAQEKSIALICDAGTPGISDPGTFLIAEVRRAGYAVVPIPGANAAITALSAAGLSAPHFLFYGFLPHQQGARRKQLETLSVLPYTLVFYESPHRVVSSLSDMQAILGGGREVILAREITKLFETIHSCTLNDILVWIQADQNRVRGEFVLIVQGADVVSDIATAEVARILRLLLETMSLADATKLTSRITGEKKNKVYEVALVIKDESV